MTVAAFLRWSMEKVGRVGVGCGALRRFQLGEGCRITDVTSGRWRIYYYYVHTQRHSTGEAPLCKGHGER